MKIVDGHQPEWLGRNLRDILEKKGLLDTRNVKQLCSICDLSKKHQVKGKLTVCC